MRQLLWGREAMGISEEVAKEALSGFSGTYRRFEYKGKTNIGALVYDDYAHHPAEVKVTPRRLAQFI
jgi:UDP-N-acetylmuramate--alanine ligase